MNADCVEKGPMDIAVAFVELVEELDMSVESKTRTKSVQ
jgi:hypothetical protein